MTSERDGLRRQFLIQAGWGDAASSKLADDASFRTYDRLFRKDRRAVLMNAPPDKEDVRPFIAVARYLTGLGLAAPRILDTDITNGFLLLEDLGDGLFASLMDKGAEAAPLYDAAIDVLAELHRERAPDWLPVAEDQPQALKPYHDGELTREADLFIDWYWPMMTGREATAAERAEYQALWAGMWAAARSGPPVMVLRDYHAQNLMWLEGRSGLGRVGLLDFQDALAGDAAYDLISLTEDARRDVPTALQGRMVARYMKAAKARAGFDPARFEMAMAVLAAQRNTKIIGIFARLWRRDGKPKYLSLIPRVWRHLTADLARPGLEPLRAWFDSAVPPAQRTDPPAP